MAFVKRTWLARIGTGLNKFIIGAVDGNGKQTLVNSPDSITQQGDVISADNLNDLEDRIDNEFVGLKDYADTELYKKQNILIGSVIWFSGEIANAPSSCLVCNGQNVSRTTYARLFAIIGTKYGEGDGSTTFTLPDLSDGNGRFIRAGFTDEVIGTKQDDAIRNITGTFISRRAGAANVIQSQSGAFSIGSDGGSTDQMGISGRTNQTRTNFNANDNTGSYGNPMTGHANGADIHPYDVYMLPLIVAY